MKFIKTADGWYIDKDKIDSFTVAKYFDRYGNGTFAVFAYINGVKWRFKEFAELTTQDEAQARLDNFIVKLNGVKENANLN